MGRIKIILILIHYSNRAGNSRPTLLYCTIRALTVRTAYKLPPVTAKDGSPLASSDQLHRWKDPLASSWNLQHNSRASEIRWSPHYLLDGPSVHAHMEILCHPPDWNLAIIIPQWKGKARYPIAAVSELYHFCVFRPGFSRPLMSRTYKKNDQQAPFSQLFTEYTIAPFRSHFEYLN